MQQLKRRETRDVHDDMTCVVAFILPCNDPVFTHVEMPVGSIGQPFSLRSLMNFAQWGRMSVTRMTWMKMSQVARNLRNEQVCFLPWSFCAFAQLNRAKTHRKRSAGHFENTWVAGASVSVHHMMAAEKRWLQKRSRSMSPVRFNVKAEEKVRALCTTCRQLIDIFSRRCSSSLRISQHRK
jgi:hypothetical protein